MSTTLIRRTTTAQDYNLVYSSGSDSTVLLNDESSGTYIAGVASIAHTFLSLDPVTIPAGAQIRYQTIKVEAQGTGGFMSVTIEGLSTKSPGEPVAYAVKPPNVPTTYTFTRTTVGGKAWSPTTVNAAEVGLWLTANVQVNRLEVDCIYNEKPVTTVLSIDGSPAAPQWSTSSQRPRIYWDYYDPDGDAQERYELKIFTDQQYNTKGFNASKTPALFYSGSIVSNSSNYKLTKSLPNGTYWVAARTSDVGSSGRTSDWDIEQFNITGSAPLPPLLQSVTPDPDSGSATVLVQQSDNLLAYNQAGFENAADGIGWYTDTNVSALNIATTAATNAEGAYVLGMTAQSASQAWIRSGGHWTDLGIGGFLNISQNATREPNSVSDSYPTSATTLRTASFTPKAGDCLIAFVAFKTAVHANPTATATVASSPSMTWTKQAEALHSVDGYTGYVAIFTAFATQSVPTTVSVTGGTVKYGRYLKVSNYSGPDPNDPVGITGHGGYATGNLSVSYTSTVNGSLGFVLSIDDKGGTIALPTNSGLVGADPHYHQDPTYTVSLCKRTSNTPQGGMTVPFSETGERGEVVWVVIELIPAATPPKGIPSDLLAGVPVSADTTYTVTAGAWVASVANSVRNCRIDVEWYDSTATLISVTTGTQWATTAGNVLTYWAENMTSPDYAETAVMILNAMSPSANEVYHFDRVGLMLGSNQNWGRGGMQSRNLLNVIDGSQEGGNVGTWSIYPTEPSTVLSVIADANIMSGYALQTYNPAPSGHTAMVTTDPYYNIDVGSDYTFYTMARTQSGTYDGLVYLNFLDENSAIVSGAKGALTALSPTSWSVLSVTGTCPDGAVAAQPVLRTVPNVGASTATVWTRHGISPGDVIPTAWQPGPLPNTYPLVETSDDGGVTWTAVNNTEDANYDPDNSWLATVVDYEAPSNAPRQYRVSTAGLDYGIDPSGFYVVSLPSQVLTSTLPVTDFYLVDSTAPSRFLMEQDGEVNYTIDEPQTTFSPLGRSTDLVTYDTVKSRHFTFNLTLLSGDQLDDFEALRATGRILFLQTPYARSWYVKLGPEQKTTWLISPDVTGRFNVTIDVIEVARPS